MARITVEDCLSVETNRFALVQLASKRAKQLLAGSAAKVDTKGNKSVVSALREVAASQVRFMTAEEQAEAIEKQKEQPLFVAAETIIPPMPKDASLLDGELADLLGSSAAINAANDLLIGGGDDEGGNDDDSDSDDEKKKVADEE